VRGRVRSRSQEEIVNEVTRLSQNGYREIVLTGIETGAYGEDFSERASLPDLVEAVSAVSGIERIRFGSLKPSLFTDEFCSRLSAVSRVMPHFHLSLQSGSDRVLAAMRRKYGREEALRAIETIYRYFPDAGLSADLICGFPGETEPDFLETVSLVEEAKLLHTHIFPFSPREGTRAYEMKDDVPPEEKKRRCACLLSKAKEMSIHFALQREGRTYRVLCERIRSGFAFGYTENFIYTKTPASPDLAVGEVFPVVLSSEQSFSVETMTVVGKNMKTVDNF
jgi:threonylcarbamoyladenosine tRNA methylthiotransferase MtaB